MDAPTFRANFTEFSDAAKYPDTLVDLWLGVGASLVNSARWCAMYDMGLQLCTAHHLVLSSRDEAAAAVGGVPGELTGPTASKSVDKVSVSYDTGAAALTDAGFWNLTSYGVRFLTLARMMGSGGIQV